MGKNKSASNLVNVIDFNNDRIAFISGSTTLMSISSSGAITVTGVISGSNAASASYALNAGLLNNRNSAEFTSTGSFNAYTSSNDATVTSVAGAAVSAVAGVNALAARTSSYTTTSSFNSYTSSNDVTMSCVSSTATSAIVGVGTLASKTGSYATTGSNVFDGGQYLSSSFNPTGFSTTASLYTDGGLRVSKDAYISGTLYLNNVTVYGTQSVCFITSSQLNISSNLISVNTSTPSVRFGGLAVYDSGSTGLTGSILWDSEANHWVYSNPSGSSYSGGMFISGPRTSTLGSETGTTACMLLAGQGGDHLTSSMIYHSSTATCIPNTLIGNVSCFTTSCAASIIGGTATFGLGAGTCINITTNSNNGTSASPLQTSLNFRGLNNNLNGQIRVDDISGTAQIGAMQFYTWNSAQVSALTLCHNAAAVFYGTVFTPTVLASGCIGIGATSPTGQLHICGSDPALRIQSTVSGNMQLGQWDGTNNRIQSSGRDFLLTQTDACNILFHTNSTERVRITGTGITTFACQVCSPSFSSTSTSYLNGLAVTCNANSNCFTGITVINGAGGGSEASRAGIAFQAYDWVQSAIWHGRNTASAFAGALLFGTNPNTANLSVGGVCTRLKIDNDGIACFSCQVCAPILVSCLQLSTTYYINGGYNSLGATTSGQMGVLGHNAQASQVTSNTITQMNNGYFASFIRQYYNEGITFYTRANAGTAGDVLYGSSPVADGGQRLRIDSAGIACFACQVCVASLITNAGGLTENFNATGGGHVNRYFAVKYMSENATHAFFKISTSGASVTHVHLAATNAGVGWYSSQVFHSGISAYWGGWVGSGTQISRVAGEAGYINGVHTDQSGNQTYCVIVANNGTSTSSLVFAYITTITYGGYSTTFTQL